MKQYIPAVLLVLSSCSPGVPAQLATSSDTYTLYRSSDGVPSARIHWATFNVDDSGGGTGTYNKGNCEMDADVLNANLKRLNNGAMPVRFWCEHGTAHDVDNRR